MKCFSVFITLVVVLLGFRYTSYYPELLEKSVGKAFDALEELEHPKFLDILDELIKDKVQLVNRAAHFNTTLKNKDFFEGWYYKIVSKDLKTTVITIPAVFFDKENSNPHAFIMHGLVQFDDNGKLLRKDLKQTTFSMETVKITNYPNDQFELKIGNSIFRNDYFKLDIPDVIKGELLLENYKEYKTTALIPSIMGFFTYIDALFGMQCVHKVLTVDSKTNGNLSILHGEQFELDLSNGRAYIEGDYGSEFPKRYFWLTSNHFASNRGSSIMLSYADVPFPNEKLNFFEFQGFIGFVYDAVKDKWYRFGTYTGATITVDRNNISSTKENSSKVSVQIKDLQYNIEITAVASKEESLTLWGPKKNKNGKFEMELYVNEMLNAQVHVSIKRRSDNSIVFEGIGEKGALEVVL